MPYTPSIPVRNAMSAVLPRHMCERAVTATGLVASLSALLSLVACGIGLSSSQEFFGVWLGLALAGLPFGPLIDRGLRPLFWCGP